MNMFIKMFTGILLALICARFVAYGFYCINSSAADFCFFVAFCSGMGSVWCFIGDLF